MGANCGKKAINFFCQSRHPSRTVLRSEKRKQSFCRTSPSTDQGDIEPISILRSNPKRHYISVHSPDERRSSRPQVSVDPPRKTPVVRCLLLSEGRKLSLSPRLMSNAGTQSTARRNLSVKAWFRQLSRLATCIAFLTSSRSRRTCQISAHTSSLLSGSISFIACSTSRSKRAVVSESGSNMSGRPPISRVGTLHYYFHRSAVTGITHRDHWVSMSEMAWFRHLQCGTENILYGLRWVSPLCGKFDSIQHSALRAAALVTGTFGDDLVAALDANKVVLAGNHDSEPVSFDAVGAAHLVHKLIRPEAFP